MGPKYKPDKFYTEDINDLVEKGGAGSGVKGHITNHPEWNRHVQAHHNLGPGGHRRTLDNIRRKMKTEKLNQKQLGDLYDQAKMHQESIKNKS